MKGAIAIFPFIHHNICQDNKRVNTIIAVYTFKYETIQTKNGVGGIITFHFKFNQYWEAVILFKMN